MKQMLKAIAVALLASSPGVGLAAAVGTDTGKIVYTQGHINPACRTLLFRSNATGAERAFRIPATAGTDINAVALAAIASQLDVSIVYDPAQTTGCGTEPAVQYITIGR